MRTCPQLIGVFLLTPSLRPRSVGQLVIGATNKTCFCVYLPWKSILIFYLSLTHYNVCACVGEGELKCEIWIGENERIKGFASGGI